MHTKQFYEAPEAELLFVKYEENIMSDTVTTHGGSRVVYGDEVDLDDPEYN